MTRAPANESPRTRLVPRPGGCSSSLPLAPGFARGARLKGMMPPGERFELRIAGDCAEEQTRPTS